MYRPSNMYRNGLHNPSFVNTYNFNNQTSKKGIKRQQFSNSYLVQQPCFEFWCETCDRGFKTKHILEEHNKQHQKCNIDGCQFFAHPKVIIKHVQMQHSTGLYKKIAKLNNPEEIEKWREDRRKKYPTKANIEKKVLEVKEKIERGEKMGMGNRKMKKDMPQKNRKSFQDNKKPYIPKSKDCENLRSTFKQKKVHDKQIGKIVSVAVETRKLKPFAGIQQIMTEDVEKESNIDTASTLIEDDDEFIIEEKQVTTTPTCTPTLCGALTSLINEYGSSDEDVEAEKHVAEQNIDNNITCSKKRKLETKDIKNANLIKQCKIDVEDNDSGPEEVKVIKQSSEDDQNVVITDKRPQKQNINKNLKDKQTNNKNVKNTYKRKIPSTLLEKLLSNEIRKERNIVLQSIRYIVSNNYFDDIKK